MVGRLYLPTGTPTLSGLRALALSGAIFAPTEAGVHTTVMNNENENAEMEEGNEDAGVAERPPRGPRRSGGRRGGTRGGGPGS